MSDLHVVGAAILREGTCLVARRGPRMSLAGKWEFPGGKVEPGESPEAALVREIGEELGVHIAVESFVGRGTAQLGPTRIVLDVYGACIVSGELVLREHDRVEWVSASELTRFDWADADVPVLAPLCQKMRAAR